MRCFSKRQTEIRKVWGAAVLGSSCGTVLAITTEQIHTRKKTELLYLAVDLRNMNLYLSFEKKSIEFLGSQNKGN